jgi:hypothetical protein
MLRDLLSRPELLLGWGANTLVALAILGWDLRRRNPGVD